ncbi:hypothetical protein [Thalassovita gelatinovora]|nr:hypothetical protein [Thalassovita gelatinovora]QIZ81842.1 hypothetical protein HFZ77_15825 [Thalassovita gelatinovora]
MYDFPSYFIAIALLGLMLVVMQLGILVGKRRQARETEDSKNQANTVQGSLLGMLALLLGFTFSLSLGRYDQRSIEVVNEANAIGTAWLRTDLVADARRDDAKTLLHQYGLIRLETSQISAANDDERDKLIAKAEALFDSLWRLASTEAREISNPVTMGFASSLNDMIDALSARDAAVNRHVPELVLFLLFGTFILLGAVVGYSSAISNIRPGVPVYAMMILIVILVFLIIDLDRPRRGLIEVDQSKLLSTVAAMKF